MSFQRFVAPHDQRADQVADRLEALAHGLALNVSVVHAFENHRELERGETHVPLQIADIAPAPLGVARAQLGQMQAAQTLAQQPQAMQLRYLQTLTTIAADKNSTIVFPLPIDLLSAVLERFSKPSGP